MSNDLYRERLNLERLEDLAPDLAGLGADEIASRVARGFFLCPAKSPLVVPRGPVETQRVSLKELRRVAEGGVTGESPIFPIRRRPDSAYSFISVGRTRNCDVAIPDESISKLHALIRESEEGFFIEDAGSKNGTAVDGRPVPKRGQGEPVLLVDGVEVRFGHVSLRFHTPEGLKALLDEL